MDIQDAMNKQIDVIQAIRSLAVLTQDSDRWGVEAEAYTILDGVSPTLKMIAREAEEVQKFLSDEDMGNSTVKTRIAKDDTTPYSIKAYLEDVDGSLTDYIARSKRNHADPQSPLMHALEAAEQSVREALDELCPF